VTAAALGGIAYLMRRSRSAPGDTFSRASRSTELAKVGSKVGGAVAVTKARKVFASAERKQELDAQLEMKTAAQVAETLGNMKGALMKLGQMASYLDDGLPEPVREALAQLQQDAPPMSPMLAAQVVTEELGAAPDKVFAEWDPTPIAAASIGQVHRAMTHDGRAVAVKVQYPGVDRAILADLDNSDVIFNMMAMMLPGFDAGPVVQELRERLVEELDYSQEAANQQLFADFYRDHPFISVPEVLPELSSRRVLTTELVDGARFSELETWSQEEKDLAAEAIYRFVFRSIYRMHAFNGDPHPGNYLFHGGGRVTFLDFGLVKHYAPDDIRMLSNMVDHIVLKPDLAAYRADLEESGLVMKGAPFSNEEMASYFGHFYKIIATDEPCTFTHEYASETVKMYFTYSGEIGKITRHSNVTPSFVILQRINLGLYALLAQLDATANWRRIAEELWPQVDAPPSTPLGEQESAWLATKAKAAV
jgi:predicted unusual protein kinase regulating ubiquinone biosynthesis (AarF/ABC1/UbiB family)